MHRPIIKSQHKDSDYPESVLWVNGSGKPLEDWFKFRGWRSIRRTVGYDWAQINHYAIKSMDAYSLRKFRGNANLKKDKYNSDYWSLQDRNEVEDTASPAIATGARRSWPRFCRTGRSAACTRPPMHGPRRGWPNTSSPPSIRPMSQPRRRLERADQSGHGETAEGPRPRGGEGGPDQAGTAPQRPSRRKTAAPRRRPAGGRKVASPYVSGSIDLSADDPAGAGRKPDPEDPARPPHLHRRRRWRC
jgi:hypothetical protein